MRAAVCCIWWPAPHTMQSNVPSIHSINRNLARVGCVCERPLRRLILTPSTVNNVQLQRIALHPNCSLLHPSHLVFPIHSINRPLARLAPSSPGHPFLPPPTPVSVRSTAHNFSILVPGSDAQFASHCCVCSPRLCFFCSNHHCGAKCCPQV